MTLYDMAQEYRANTNLLELRVLELQAAQRQTRQKEVRYRLKKRVGYLRMLINESRKAAFLMEHYYDKGGCEHDNGKAV